MFARYPSIAMGANGENRPGWPSGTRPIAAFQENVGSIPARAHVPEKVPLPPSRSKRQPRVKAVIRFS